MTIFKSLVWVALLGTIFVCALGGEASVAAQERKKAGGEKDVVKGKLAAADADKNTITITIHTFNRATQEGTDTNKTFTLSKDVKVLQDEAPVKLSELKKGYPVTLRLEGSSAASVSVDGGTVQGEFLSANLERNTVTVIAGRDLSRRVYHLLKTTTVTEGDRKTLLVRDLKPGTKLLMTRSVEDDNTVVRIQVLSKSDN